MRHLFLPVAGATMALAAAVSFTWSPFWWSFGALVPLTALGVRDMFQTRHAVLRNFPVLGHMRYLLELIRPEINQYFVESNQDGRPFSREVRSIVYQRAKKELATLPFGTQKEVTAIGYEWMNHSMYPERTPATESRILIGGSHCEQPYSASLLNVSAMSYGALSKNAIAALNGGAKDGGFFHNTGEGGISPHHLEHGGDLVWQIGTSYFGCRDETGRFSDEVFAEKAQLEQVKMIEIKLSQGAKPGHGGILPKEKITDEVAEIRGVPKGADVISPPFHTAFHGPEALLRFVDHLRGLSGGKPVGFKLCVGSHSEFEELCLAMIDTGLTPDFITIDGGEGGTGAAPLEFANSMGSPLADALPVVDDLLARYGLRDEIKLIASGRILTAFQMAQRLAMGADLCASARGMMLALGCIQALRCNSNVCPVGVATQDEHLVAGLVVGHKRVRVMNYQHETVHTLMELCAAAGLRCPSELTRFHINRRVSSTETQTYAEIYGPGRLPDFPFEMEEFDLDQLESELKLVTDAP
ncbi:MAG: FMN-binding glutamate synthase family protein [Planctomycetota bacterium]|nr:FMN-binding glutamate synthase family protein [Planctomycetota bacterium]